MKATSLFGCLFIFSSIFAQSNSSIPSENVNPNLKYTLFNSNPNFDSQDFNTYVRKATWLKLKKEHLQRLYETKPQSLVLNIPLANGTELKLVLEKKQILSADFNVKTPKGGAPYQQGLYYQGHIQRKNNSIAAISIFEDMVMGVVADEEGNYVLGHLYQDILPAGEDYIFYKESDLEISNNFDCMTDDLPIFEHPEPSSTPNRNSSNKVVRIYIEAGFALYEAKGDISNTTNYITGFFNVVNALYEEEEVSSQISEIFIWTTADPYPTSSSSEALNTFKDRLEGNFNGDIAHLVTVNGAGGGIAYVGVLCFKSLGVAYSNISTSYSEFPTYSWTVEVFSHEMGHNLGSPHTHSCYWPGGAIDNCYTVEGDCNPGPAPDNGGTIMSYCHLSSTGINFENGFGPLPGDRIRTEVEEAECLTNGDPMPNLTKLTDSYTLNDMIINVTHRVSNTGDGNAIANTVNFYLSEDTYIGDSDIMLGTKNVPALSAGASSGNINFSIDLNELSLNSGTYYVGYVIDPEGMVLEGNEADNRYYWADQTITVVGYCHAAGENSASEWIESISIGSFYNDSGNNGGYGVFNNMNPIFPKGTDLSVTLEPGFSSSTYAEYWRIWMDLNNDFDFDDAGELVFDSGSSVVGIVTGTMSIPNSVSTSNTRMRVSMRWVQGAAPCESFNYGEVEDYTIVLSEDGNLPLSLLDFSGKIQKNINQLTWTTAQEENTSYHILQRSIDEGKTFEFLGKVEAAGNSNTPMEYIWEDPNPAKVSYYKLQTVDADGATYFSNIIRLERAIISDWTMEEIFPNPSSSFIHIGVNAPIASNVNLQITDLIGKILLNQSWQVAEGINKKQLDINELPSGVYFVILENPTGRTVKKLSKQ